jgi:hypothetical protein
VHQSKIRACISVCRCASAKYAGLHLLQAGTPGWRLAKAMRLVTDSSRSSFPPIGHNLPYLACIIGHLDAAGNGQIHAAGDWPQSCAMWEVAASCRKP